MHLFDLPRNGVRFIRNAIRSLRRKGLDVVVLPLEGSFPERTPRRAPLPFPLSMLPMLPSEVSLEEMRETIAWLRDDERVDTVVFRFRDLQAGGAALCALRSMILGLRDRGKRTIAWLPSADTWDYYLASACHEIILPPSGRLNILGLRTEALFLKDTLAMAGIKADLESIAEYKVTPDMFRRSSMTEAHREMLDAILDSLFEHLLTTIAERRDLAKDQLSGLIDQMPMSPRAALERGLIDRVLYEDELPAHLVLGETETKALDSSHDEDVPGYPALVTADHASRWLKRPATWTTRQRIGVVSLEGMIVPGKSRRMPSPLPLPVQGQAGAETITATLRQAEADPRLAAVILHIDSPGGSSLASDLIWRQVRRLRESKPVVALMGDQAASGGYYVAAPASRIVAQPTTLTGSIGIWGGKFVLGELYDRLEIGHRELQRGAGADLYSEFRPFDEEARRKVRQELSETYARFKRVVAEGRPLSEDEVEEIARGRIWTGEQASQIGLVDELGDFQTALALAKELAELDPEREYTVVQVTPPREDVLPRPFPGDGDQTWRALRDLILQLNSEHVWAMAPWLIRVRGQ